jgi:hypothetical protein
MADLDRLIAYLKDLEDIQDRLRFGGYYDNFQAKLMEYLEKNQIKKLKQAQARRLVDRYFPNEYGTFVGDVLNEYNNMIELVNEKYADLGVDISRDFSELRRIETVNRVRLGGFREDLSDYIARKVRVGLTEDMDYTELANYLRKDAGGTVKFYANTLAKTQISGYGQVAKTEKARIAEVELFTFIGLPLRENSHAFCVAMYDVTSHIDDIKKMKNGTYGRLPVLYYGGGYNCVHDMEPDPLAKEASGGEWQELQLTTTGRVVKVKSPRQLVPRN